MDMEKRIKQNFNKVKVLFTLMVISFFLSLFIETAIIGYIIFFIWGCIKLGSTTMLHFIYEEKTKSEIKKYVHKSGMLLLGFMGISLTLEYFGLDYYSILTSGVVGTCMGMIIIALIYERTFLR